MQHFNVYLLNQGVILFVSQPSAETFTRHYYEYFTDKATEEIPGLKKFFPGCTNIFGCVQLSDRLSNTELVLTTGTTFSFRGQRRLGCPMLFVCGILYDEAARKDPLQFREGTSSMSLFLVSLNAIKSKTGLVLKGGFDDYVAKCIANANTGEDLI